MLDSLYLEPNYNTYENDVTNDFYNKVLKESVIYERVSAYFSSKSLAKISKGLAYFYMNKGKYRLLISEEISEEDYNLIKEGYELRKELEEKLLNEIADNGLNEEDLMNISNLAFLIEKKLIEIKIAFKKEGIFHDKFGILKDSNNNELYFRGSNNETKAAIENNYESFDITCSWLSGDFEYKKIEKAQNQFENLWNNKVEEIIVLDIPNVLKLKLLTYSKGKIITQKPIGDYFIQFDYDEKNRQLVADLGSKVKINEKNYIYKIDLKLYVSRIEDNKIYFKNDISYLKYRKIIDLFKEYSKDEDMKENFSFISTTIHFEDYMEKKDFKINQRYELGKSIKEENIIKNNEIERSFYDFSNVLSNNMVRTLKNKQLWNAFHIVKMKKSANFSVPGSGKTTIVYGAYAYLDYNNLVNKIVMIGPKSSFLSWIKEFYLNFGDKKSLKVCNIQEIDKKEFIEKSHNSNLILVNYEALPGIEKELNYIIDEKTLLVFDEIHKIKGINKVRSSVAINISEKPIYKVVLTGTPIPNGYEDIYNMLNILYKDEYNDFFGFSLYNLKNTTETMATEINNKIYPFFCRTTKKDLKVPYPEDDIILLGEVNSLEEQLYIALKEKYKSNPFTYYIRMMQAMSNPELLLKDLNDTDLINIFRDDCDENIVEDDLQGIEDYKKIDDSYIIELIKKIGETNKFKKAINCIQELVNQNKKVLVWGIFTNTLSKIKETLNSNNISAKVIDGSIVDLKEREKIIEEFLERDLDVLIANPNTLAESVSLHTKCHDAVYLEYSFNYTHMAQSRDRINRLGLKDSDYTRYYYAMCDDYNCKKSVDRIIYERLIYKQEVMLKAIESGNLESYKENLTEDVLKLLEDN